MEDIKTYFGYPTPVKPLHPTYAPFGKYLIKSSGWASFLSNEGRRTRAVKAADAWSNDEEAMSRGSVKQIQLLRNRNEVKGRKEKRYIIIWITSFYISYDVRYGRLDYSGSTQM
jgi:hypothetical protein